MQGPERRAAFVNAGAAAGKLIRDADPKAWVANSMGSAESRAKAKATSQSAESREKARQRELSKPEDERIRQAKHAQMALVAKLGGEEAYRKYLSDRNKGRKKYINAETGNIKYCVEKPEDYMLLTEYNKLQKLKL